MRPRPPRFGPPGFPGAEQPKSTRKAHEHSTYTRGESVGDVVTVTKRYELKADATDSKAGLTLMGDARITFDNKDGYPRSVDFKATLTVTSNNTTRRVPLTVTYKLLEGPERDKVLNPPVVAKEDPKAPAKEDRKRPARANPNPAAPADVTQLLADLKEKTKAQITLGHLARAKVDEARRAEVARAVEPLLADENQFVRKAAVEALGTWGTKESVALLLPMVETKDTFVRWEAFKTLAKLQDERAAEPIARRLLEPSDRGFVSRALQDLGSKAEKAIHPYLKEKDLFTRLTACQILEKIGTKESKAALEEASKDENIGVSSTAKRALKAIEGRP